MAAKDNQIRLLKSELQEITNQFEENWQVIGQRDEIVEKLQKELKELDVVREESRNGARTHANIVTDLAGRQTELEDRAMKISVNVHDLRVQAGRIRAEIEKMNEAFPSANRLPIEDEVDRLTTKREEALKVIGQVRLLTNQIHREGTEELEKVGVELAAEYTAAKERLAFAEERRHDITRSLKDVQTELVSCVERLGAETQAVTVGLAMTHVDNEEVTGLTAGVRRMEIEIAELEEVIAGERRVETERMEMVKSIEKRLMSKKESNRVEAEKIRALLIEEGAIVAELENQLEVQLERNEELAALNSEEPKVDGPEAAEILRMEREKLENEMNDMISKETERKNEMERALEERRKKVQAKKGVCRALVAVLPRIAVEKKKGRGYIKSMKQKMRAMTVRQGELRGELSVLEHPESDKKAIDRDEYVARLRQLHYDITIRNEAMKAEMDKLTLENEKIRSETAMLERDNAAIRDYLSPCEKIAQYYYKRFRPGRTGPGYPESMTGTRIVLECGNVRIQTGS